MADARTSELASLPVLASGDLVEVVDVSDNLAAGGMADSGTNKKMTASAFLNGAWPLQPLSPANNTIPYYTGALTASLTNLTAESRTLLALGTPAGWRGELNVPQDVTDDWASFSPPTWTNLTVGTGGTSVYEVFQIGGIVHVRFQMQLGTSPTMGTNPLLTMPITIATDLPNAPLGSCRIIVSGTGYPGHVIYNNTTNVAFRLMLASGTYTTYSTPSASVPAAWAANDIIAGNFFYKAA